MRVRLAGILSLLVACGTSAGATEADGGPAGGKADDPEANGRASIYAAGNRLEPWDGDDDYVDRVQPVVARQCVTCHGCGDSPCQLKLTSFEGMLRGSNEDDLYGTRVFGISREYDPMHLAYGRRLAEDGSVDFDATEEAWRDEDFYSVLEHDTDSVLARVLTEAHDVTTDLDQAFELRENLGSRAFECVGDDDPDGDKMVGRAMPLGLPPLESHKSETLVDWLEAGGAGPSSQAQLEMATPANASAVEEWERFLNPDASDARGQLVARYLYEHLFFAHLHLERSPGEFYRIVRSRSRTGAIDEVLTERIFDVPDDDFFYRLEKHTSVLVAKNHITWELGPKTMQRWTDLFLEPDWSMDGSDNFDPESGNPFAYFDAIPADIRYRFMLESSKHLVDAMVRGSVCTGAGATFAIRDRFWVWFLEPDSDVASLAEVDGERTGGPNLGEGSWFHLNPESANPLRENDYLRAYRKQLQRHRPDGLGIDDLWTGDDNPNAWLTVLRHDKSASVHHGPQGGQPETIWVLNYSNFERLYYNLVVQFKTWSHAAHKLETWTLMSYVRSEGEDLFATMLEPSLREELRDHPTRGWGSINSTIFPSYGTCGGGCEYPTAVDFPPEEGDDLTARLDGQMRHIAGLVADHVGVSIDDPLNEGGDVPDEVRDVEGVEAALASLTAVKSEGWQHLPEIMLVRVDGSLLYTVYANRVYAAHERVYQESLERVPAEDTLSVSRGIVGAYPGLFVDLSRDEVPKFVDALRSIRSAEDWKALVLDADEVIIDRSSDRFWTFLDEVHVQWFGEDPVEAAVLDVSEYLWPQEL